MKKSAIILSLAALSALAAENTMNMGSIKTKTSADDGTQVTSTQLENTKSTDLAKTLSENSPDITFKRTTGAGQDIFVRGFGYEDVNIEIDNTKLYGACPNHMDPPLAHISSSEIEDISVERGPFDVTSFGNLGAKVDVKTKSPTPGVHGNADAKYGSYDYQNYSGRAAYGSKYVDLEAGADYASQKPYEDGSGQNIVDGQSSPAYKSGTDDTDLYKTYGYYLKGKLKPLDTLEIGADVGIHKTDQALYPGKAMDGVKDNTTRAKGSMAFLDLGSFSDRLELSLYTNEVDHDMDNYSFRMIAAPMAAKTITQSYTNGFNVANQKAYEDFTIEYGANGYTRHHKADMNRVNTGASMQMLDGKVNDVGGYVDGKIPFDSNLVSIGVRYDQLNFKNESQNIAALTMTHGSFDDSRDENTLGGYLKLDHYLGENGKIYGGVGRSYRAPTPVELYIVAQSGTWVGNPNLNLTQNDEADLGAEFNNDTFSANASVFYSSLKDYIYPVAVTTMSPTGPMGRKTYQNIDANIYGGMVGGGYNLTQTINVKAAVSYQVGEKDSGTDKDLVDIPPLKTITSLNYDDGMIDGSLEWIAAATQDKVDSTLNQPEVAGWGILNLRGGYEPIKNLELSAGIENLLNQTYALSTSFDINPLNPTTYIVNEPGRTFYIGGNYKF